MKSTSTKQRLFRRSIRIGFLLVSIGLGFAIAIRAHDPGLSSIDLSLDEGPIVVLLTFARGDIESLIPIDADRDGRITSSEFKAALPRLEALARDAVEVGLDGERVLAGQAEVEFDEGNNIHFRLIVPRRSGQRLALRSAILASLSPGHRQYLAFRDAQGTVLGERMLRANADKFEADLTRVGGAARKSPFGQFFVLGVDHILTGYDHLVFLMGLLLAGAAPRMALKIITSFTLAHSITLALATFNLVQIPPRVVEPLIAISIVYVGIENVFSRDLKHRWLLTFAFGLAHGFGFASALRESGIGSGGSGVVVPLLSFNLGVELGQIVIAALALPLIWHLRRNAFFVTRYAPACSVLVALAGGYWLIERILLK